MANLTVESLNNVIQSGDVSRMYSGTESLSRESRAGEGGQVSGAQTGGPSAPGKTFSDILTDSMGKVNLYQHEADTAIKELVAGRNKNIHETMLTIERADTSLKLMMQVRNKILDAYKEILRMQV
ncbi:MAG: flagellar hook-basal body complex protein FliE [Bdellovibrionia bacterium]